MSELNDKIISLRQDYLLGELDESTVDPSPFGQFGKWFEEAIKAEVPEPNAVSLGTADKHGRPSVRVVLLRKFSEEGFTFFTNYESKKGKNIGENPFACMNFFWPELQRQIRIEGRVEFVSSDESDEYFTSRPRNNRISAWVSPQSTEIPGRDFLEQLVHDYNEKFQAGSVPRPDHWGGYRIIPEFIEFWQGRESRLHDRIGYRKEPDDSWKIIRLAP